MKKILSLILVIMSFAGSAFALDLATATPTAKPGSWVRAGADQTTANNSATPVIQFSTGVHGMVNFTSDAAAKTSPGYLIATRHTTGSKNFATASDLVNIYWKQATKVAGTVTAPIAMTTDINASADSATTFAAGLGWTSY